MSDAVATRVLPPLVGSSGRRGPLVPAQSVVLRPMTVTDTAVTAGLQCSGLPRSFVAQLGARFVRGLHDAFLASPHVVGVVAVSTTDARVVGFSLGSTDARNHASHVLRSSRNRLAVLGGLGLLARPRLVPRFARRRASRYARRLFAALLPSTRAPVDAPRSAGSVGALTALVVEDAYRNSGLGGRLAEAFVDAAETAGSVEVMLVTRVDTTSAVDFWERHGWHRVDVHDNLDGERIASMSRRLPAPDGAVDVERSESRG